MARDHWSREPLPRPPAYWQPERLPGDQLVDELRHYSHPEVPDIRRPPVGIDRALREQCNIPAQHYFVAVVLDDGKTKMFAGPQRPSSPALNSFFNMERYLRWVHRQDSSTASSIVDETEVSFGDHNRQAIGAEYGGRRTYAGRRNQTADDLDDEDMYKTRKKPRTQMFRREPEPIDDEPAVQIVPSRRGIKIGNQQEVWDFCDQRFKNLQQTACKLIAKAWVKLVEPKKQSTHPYTGAEKKAPDWWPRPWGTTKEEKVRHKEPDHLYKKERVHLLNHILRMIVEPNVRQHTDIQKLNLNVSKLEEATFDALAAFFTDKENPNNAKKKPYLKEIFKIARYEEKLKNGEIDADTEVYVMADDKIPDNYQSDDENGSTAKDDDENEPSSAHASASPQKSTSHGIMAGHSTEHSPAGNLQNAPFMNDLPVRPTYPTQVMATELGSSQQGYVANVTSGSLPVNPQTSLHTHSTLPLQSPFPDPHDASRRPSIFASPTEYTSPAAPAIYQSWQQSTTAPSNTPMYSFHSQQPAPQQPHFVQQPPVPAVPMTQNPPYLSSDFDGMPRSPYETTNQSSVFRNNTIPPVTMSHSQGYSTYMPHDARSLHPPGMKVDPMGRDHMH